MFCYYHPSKEGRLIPSGREIKYKEIKFVSQGWVLDGYQFWMAAWNVCLFSGTWKTRLLLWQDTFLSTEYASLRWPWLGVGVCVPGGRDPRLSQEGRHWPVCWLGSVTIQDTQCHQLTEERLTLTPRVWGFLVQDWFTHYWAPVAVSCGVELWCRAKLLTSYLENETEEWKEIRTP